ncbi:small gtp binding protein rab8 [Anaeramoeba flamelloides]|uniref:Small gtp binding protein rab8 n=1 Tax=Anaeramoeba flamelloides TaxID=1746091 RepID=A0ABQ8XH80_9EUKA|nr:small gtp binding protein rab8 [Anaeramoeba flamelloides]
MLGRACVGKTSILYRFSHNTFSTSILSTNGMEYFNFNLEIDQNKYFIRVLDTAGQDSYTNILNWYVRDANGVFLVYDISDKKSFRILDKYIALLEEKCIDKPVVLLIGNKCDLDKKDRVITLEMGTDYAKKKKVNFIETSAKKSENIEKAFRFIVELMVEKQKHHNIIEDVKSNKKAVSLNTITNNQNNNDNKEKKKSCC